jgi:hypothetical protein
VSDPFATAGELSQLIGNTEPTDLARMQLFLDLASAEIRRYTGQTLSTVAGDVIILPALERTTLVLPERPVTAITTVVAGSVTVPSTDYWFTRAGLLHSGTIAVEGTFWSLGATVTYDHGYAETTDEYKAIKAVCLESASRAYTLNERSASEAIGATLMESAGYAPEVFLTLGEKMSLADFGKVLVG